MQNIHAPPQLSVSDATFGGSPVISSCLGIHLFRKQMFVKETTTKYPIRMRNTLGQSCLNIAWTSNQTRISFKNSNKYFDVIILLHFVDFIQLYISWSHWVFASTKWDENTRVIPLYVGILWNWKDPCCLLLAAAPNLFFHLPNQLKCHHHTQEFIWFILHATQSTWKLIDIETIQRRRGKKHQQLENR